MVTVSFFSRLLRLTCLCNHPKCTEPQLHLAYYLQGKDHMAPISHAVSCVFCVCNGVCVYLASLALRNELIGRGWTAFSRKQKPARTFNRALIEPERSLNRALI
jgi:hypothetical protein